MYGSNNRTVAELVYDISKNIHDKAVVHVLDVGVGFGFLAQNLAENCVMHGDLVEYEGYDQDDVKNYLNNKAWRIQVHGVEANKEYQGSGAHNFFYADVAYETIQEFMEHDVRIYDIAVASDVLEHLSQDDAVKVLDFLEKNSTYVVISVPTFFYKGHDEISEFEYHRCHFSTKFMLDRGYNMVESTGDSNTYVLSTVKAFK